MSPNVSRIVRGAVIAAVYAITTIIFQPLSYGPIQVRISEALTLLPRLWAEAVPGLFIGCMIANVFGGYGLPDILLGGAATLIAAVMSRHAPDRITAAAAPVAVNALMVGWYLSVLTDTPITLTVLYVGFGEATACFALGLPLLRFLEKTNFPGKK
jgi:uncharacterized membrane protein